MNKTIILTGNNKIEEKLQEQDVDFQKIKIVYKPASYKTIASVIKEKQRDIKLSYLMFC